jgi:Icc-related predicted phosphoesterase
VRLYFATDIHGSETCWRRFLNCSQFYRADVLVLGGDLTGKAVIPIIHVGSDRYRTHLQDQRHDFEGDDELARYRKIVRDLGYYPVVMDDDEFLEFSQDASKIDGLFTREMRRVAEEWVAMADERLPTNVPCVVCPGNDDREDIDEIIASSNRIQLGEGKVIDLPGDYQLVSTGWSNPTPWNTPREEDEAALRNRIEVFVARADGPADRLILGLHAPPIDTALDVAPKIDWETLVVQAQASVHAGSIAVRELIEEVQPLLSLHGHIHESRASVWIGRTLSLNPGSAYDQGTLMGCIVELQGQKKVKRYKFTSG